MKFSKMTTKQVKIKNLWLHHHNPQRKNIPVPSRVNGEQNHQTTVQKTADAEPVPIGRRRTAVRHLDSKRHVTASAADNYEFNPGPSPASCSVGTAAVATPPPSLRSPPSWLGFAPIQPLQDGQDETGQAGRPVLHHQGHQQGRPR
jgi:hypothetical protein